MLFGGGFVGVLDIIQTLIKLDAHLKPYANMWGQSIVEIAGSVATF